MASVSGKSLEQLQAMRQSLMDQGKTLSTSKELGKIENAIKVLNPSKYGASQVASATKALLSSTTPETQAQLGIAPAVAGSSAGGTTGASAGMFGTGTSSRLDLNKMYTEAMGGSDITGLEKQIADKKTALTQAMTNINDNPYYSEATRTGTLAKLQETAGREINDLTDQLTLKKADIQTKLNIATQQYNIDSQEYQNNLNRLNTLISTGAISGASANDIAQISQATGMSTQMVKSIMEKVRLGNRNLQTATNSQTGDVTVYDINTGQVVSTIKGIGKQAGTTKLTEAQTQRELISNASAALSSMTGTDGKVSESTYQAVKQSFINQGGGTGDEFDKLFYGYANLTVNPSRYGIKESIYSTSGGGKFVTLPDGTKIQL